MPRLHFAASLATAAGVTASISAQTTSWLDTTDGNWLDPARWTDGVPNAATDVVIDPSGRLYRVFVTTPASAGTVTLDSDDAILILDPGGSLSAGTLHLRRGNLSFEGGTLSNTTLVTNGGNVWFFSSTDNTLDNVLIQGDLDVANSNAAFRWRNGTRATGTVRLSGNGTTLAFEGSQTFDGTIVSSGVSNVVAIDSDTRLIVGETGSIRNVDFRGAFAGNALGNRELINRGTLRAPSFSQLDAVVNEGTVTNGLSVASSVSSFINTGTIQAAGGIIDAIAWRNDGNMILGGGELSLRSPFTLETSGLADGRISGVGAVCIATTLNNVGTNLVTDALGFDVILKPSGNIVGGTLETGAGNAIQFSGGSGSTRSRLTDVQVLGDLNLGAGGVDLLGNTRVSGTVRLAGGTFRVIEPTSLDYTIEGEGTIALFRNGFTLESNAVIDGAFDIGGGDVINNGSIRGNLDIRFADFINNGSIQRSLVFQSSGTFTQNGLIESNGRLRIVSDQFINSGHIEVSGGSDDLLGADTIESPGTIFVSDGRLTLSGRYTNAGVGLSAGRITGNPDALLELCGQLDNTGSVLRSDAFNGTLRLSGEVIGGSLETIAGRDFEGFANSSNGVVFNNVSLANDFDVDRKMFLIQNTLSGPGTLTDSGSGFSFINFAAGATLNTDAVFTNGRVEFGLLPIVDGESSAALGSDADILVNNLILESTSGSSGSLTNLGRLTVVQSGTMQVSDLDTVTNEGAIAIQSDAQFSIESSNMLLNGGSFTAGPNARIDIRKSVNSFVNTGEFVAESASVTIAAGDWSNSGSISIINSELHLAGPFGTTAIGIGTSRFDVSGSEVTLTGRVNNTAATLPLGDLGAALTLDGATITGGQLRTDGTDSLSFTSLVTTLNNVEIIGNLNLNDDARVDFTNGTTVSGDIRAAANIDRLIIDGDFTITQGLVGIVDPGSTNKAPIAVAGDLTIAQDARVEGGALDLRASKRIGEQRRLINRGTIAANAPSSEVRISGFTSIVNDGLLEARNGGTLDIASGFSELVAGVLTEGIYRVFADSTMNLGGTIVENRASIGLYGTAATLSGLELLERNTGQLTLAGAVELNLAGPITFDDSGTLTIVIEGSGPTLSGPSIDAGSAATLGGRLVLDLSAATMTDESVGRFVFINAPTFLNEWTSIDIIGIDPDLVIADRQSGTFFLVPAPSTATVAALFILTASRRRRQ